MGEGKEREEGTREERVAMAFYTETGTAGSIIPANILNDIAARVHEANQKWWHDLHTGHRIDRNVGELLMLTVTELAEALEGHRKGLMDDHLPQRRMFEVEIADAVIRLMDIAGGLGLDLDGTFWEKLAYNKRRQDHTNEARLKEGGKKY